MKVLILISVLIGFVNHNMFAQYIKTTVNVTTDTAPTMLDLYGADAGIRIRTNNVVLDPKVVFSRDSLGFETDRKSIVLRGSPGHSWLALGDKTSPDVLTIRSGNVGIGTGTVLPDSKLTVGGKIHSREIKVTVNAGADFVFEDNYSLKPLKDLEEYIKLNKHLPEIAPASKMKEDGLELGEMSVKLLQKIEELTLYIINQDKRFNREITVLREQIDQLRK